MWLNESTHAEKQPHVHPRERLADQPQSRIFHTFERRVRARSLQQSRALVGRVPSRGALLAFPAVAPIHDVGRWRPDTPLAPWAACTQVYKPSPQCQGPTTSEPTSGLNGSPRWAQPTEIRFKERKHRLESGPHCVRRVAAKRFGKINRTAMLFSGGQVP